MTEQAAPATHRHPFDERLEDANMFAWFGPMFELLKRHWLIALGAGVLTYLLAMLVDMLPWPLYGSPWLMTLHGFVNALLSTFVAVAAYRMVAEREGAGFDFDEVNSWAQALVSALQICVVWTILYFAVGKTIVWILGKIFAALLPQFGEAGLMVLLMFGLYAIIAIPIVIFLLSPLWTILSVAGALSSAHAVRSLDNGLNIVLTSLRLSYDQRSRVFWPCYVIGAVLIAAFLLFQFGLDVSNTTMERIIDVMTVLAVMVGVVLTFIIERAYTPELGVLFNEADAAPVAVAEPVSAIAKPAPAQATGSELARHIDEELRANRTVKLADLVEQGLKVDPKFFADYPDSTLALGKKLSLAKRPDLALRLLQPFIKDQRGHRLHLMVCLLAADLLIRDSKQLKAAARFLSQLKSLYPNEPMIEKLAIQTNKALTEGGS